MRVVVTGASGNIGTSVVRALEADPRVDAILGVVRRIPRAWPGRAGWRAADVARDDLGRAFAGADAVIHLAWALNPSRDREEKRRINVDGSRRVLEAAARAGAAVLVHASSIGAYSPGPKDRFVDESHPTDGIPGFDYSEDKVAVERMLDDAEAAGGGPALVRLRPVLVLKREAAAHLRRELAGPWLPNALARRAAVAVLPGNPRLVVQVAHADDVAEAFRLAMHARIPGAFNIGTEPPLTAAGVAELLGARTIRVGDRALRAAHATAFHARLIPAVPGWTDETLYSPLVSSERAHRDLAWSPTRSPQETLLETLDGIRRGDGGPTPPLDPRAGGPLRIREVLTGLGARGSN